ncbi:actin nucleation-promoting factor WAS [Penaeus vannamei]|uniref:actin nucleation-promoting factor WAS n=1 Tax=Penaeus vannamei TaxID=6689 RepID=UPI00387F9B2E
MDKIVVFPWDKLFHNEEPECPRIACSSLSDDDTVYNESRKTSQPPECSEECHKWSKKIRIKRSGKDKAKEALRKDQGVTMAGQTRPTPHKPSNKLSEEENQAVFKMLDLRCLAQATAVVQMYGTEPPHHSSWYKIHCGVATFTKDNIRKSFFIQVYDFATGQRVFEQEIYREFSYHDSRPHFHQFESDEKMIGFNFADETDSKNFHAAVSNLLLNRKKKREEHWRDAEAAAEN